MIFCLIHNMEKFTQGKEPIGRIDSVRGDHSTVIVNVIGVRRDDRKGVVLCEQDSGHRTLGNGNKSRSLP